MRDDLKRHLKQIRTIDQSRRTGDVVPHFEVVRREADPGPEIVDLKLGAELVQGLSLSQLEALHDGGWVSYDSGSETCVLTDDGVNFDDKPRNRLWRWVERGAHIAGIFVALPVLLGVLFLLVNVLDGGGDGLQESGPDPTSGSSQTTATVSLGDPDEPTTSENALVPTSEVATSSTDPGGPTVTTSENGDNTSSRLRLSELPLVGANGPPEALDPYFDADRNLVMCLETSDEEQSRLSFAQFQLDGKYSSFEAITELEVNSPADLRTTKVEVFIKDPAGRQILQTTVSLSATVPQASIEEIELMPGATSLILIIRNLAADPDPGRCLTFVGGSVS